MIKKIIISVILISSFFLWEFNSESTEITAFFAIFHGVIVGVIIRSMWFNDFIKKSGEERNE